MVWQGSPGLEKRETWGPVKFPTQRKARCVGHPAICGPPDSVSSAGNVPSAPLLTCLDDFAHITYGANFENSAELQGGMVRHQLVSVLHVARLKDEDAAD